MLGRGAGKADLRAARDRLDGRRLLEDVQHAVARRKRILQRAAQIGKRDHRAEGAHQRQRRDQHAVKADAAAPVQRRGCKEHPEVERQNDGVRHRHIAARRALHARFIGRNRLGSRVHFLKARAALPVLERFREPAQAVQHKAAERAGAGAELHPVAAARL